ncbi:unnamed protein product [Acanthoscelides obtectus]|uniref:Monocarboxylate transporter n=1 Tax=Acanthoscelides obtectus TaxID=200917 RepID=A0A9P0KJU8_ACAOB|nr:unnamed protein product [Acanthoscelides obtectus]CAK1667526.1 Monocarboxylate transporter 10 [Acanthoscelides obtectus]
MASLNYTLSVSRVVTQRELQQARRCVCCPEAVLRVLSTMLDLKLMKQLSFALLVLSGFFTMVGLYSPFVFIGQRGEELGFTANWNTLLLTIMGISNTVGRIICGVVSTIPRADVMLISWSTLVIAGAATMASAFAPFLEAQIAFSVTYGLLMASFTALRAALIAEMMGLENLTNAFGITIMFYGLGSFVGIPLAGLLQNLTGKYAYGFLFAGGAILLSGILMMPIKKIVAWEASKRKKVTFLSIS